MLSRWVHCGKLRESQETLIAVHTSPDHLISAKFKQEGVIPDNWFIIFEKLFFCWVDIAFQTTNPPACDRAERFSAPLVSNTLKSNSWGGDPSEQISPWHPFLQSDTKRNGSVMHYACVHDEVRPEFIEAYTMASNFFCSRSVVRLCLQSWSSSLVD
ncbi:hypothetical protein Tco_0149162 [Tanacetum coccineum]